MNDDITPTTDSLAREFAVPTAEQYEHALSALTLSEAQREMLAFHYHAHNRTATFTELAHAAGWDSNDPANLHYGRLGYLLGEQLDIPPWTSKTGVPIYSSSLGSGYFPRNGGDMQLTMHHELAKAIARLGWFAEARVR